MGSKSDKELKEMGFAQTPFGHVKEMNSGYIIKHSATNEIHVRATKALDNEQVNQLIQILK